MESISVPCPKCPVVAPRGAWPHQPRPMILVPRPQTPLLAGSARFTSVKVAVESSSSSSPMTSTTKSGDFSSKDEEAGCWEESASQAAVPDSMISAYIAEASNLVKLVDSKDITELQLKRKDFQIIIRKKEAIPQPAPVMMQSPQAVLLPQPPVSLATPPPAAASPSPVAPAPAPPPTRGGSKSSLPSLKCPMSGTFYRCPGPGEPPFVKVGDKVQKGQVVCIIEAMKLMNEIEADQSGTVVEILAEDGKQVSVDMPLLIIQP